MFIRYSKKEMKVIIAYGDSQIYKSTVKES